MVHAVHLSFKRSEVFIYSKNCRFLSTLYIPVCDKKQLNICAVVYAVFY